MKVSFNLNSIGKNLAELINSKLTDSNLPTCIGDMSPPLVPTSINVDIENIFKLKESIPSENIIEDDVSKFVVMNVGQVTSDFFELKKYVLDVNSSTVIENTKEDLAEQYVERIKRCAAPCKYIELCNMLTTHYLSTIKISGG